MPGFLRLLPPDEARTILLSQIGRTLPAAEEIESASALHRVTADDIRAPHALPEFARSTVDGYAVGAANTFGASDSTPAYLRNVGEIAMGVAPVLSLKSGQCALIHTGGMLPDGADAVIMLEQTQPIQNRGRLTPPPGGWAGGDLRSSTRESGGTSPEEIELLRSVAPGENVIVVGEDVAAGQLVIGRGVRVRPAEIGGLMALGITRLRVAMKPRVALLSTGDEVVRAEDRPRMGQVRDVNSGALAALARDSGGEPILHGIVPDEIAIIQEVAAGALATSDLLVISGGSSASARDVTAKVIGALGEPGVLIHGISIRPGKPTILGVCGGKCVIGLPGNPVSALVIGYLFMVPVIELLLGLDSGRPRPRIAARVTTNLPSQAGREDWWPVKVTRSRGGRDEWLAEPIFSRSNLIFGLSTADGLLCIPAATTGIAAGEVADVHLV